MVFRGFKIATLFAGLLAVAGVGNAATVTMDQFVSAVNTGGSTPIVKLQITGGGSGSLGVYRQTAGNGAQGGEFRVQLKGSGSSWNDVAVQPEDTSDLTFSTGDWIYKTFCVEPGEFIVPDKAYFATIDDLAYFGTNAGGTVTPNTGKSIDDLVKLGYALYMEGQLEDAVNGLFSYDDSAKAGLFQQLIWDLQYKLPATFTASVKALYDALVDYKNTELTSAEYNRLTGGVAVLNLWEKEPVKITNPDGSYTYGVVGGSPAAKNALQSQLIYLYPEPLTGETPVLPEPATLAIWGGMMLVGAGYAMKRRKSAM